MILALLAFSGAFPYYAFAIGINDCDDSDIFECHCPVSVSVADINQEAITSVEECVSECQRLAETDPNVSRYAIQCEIDGVMTGVANSPIDPAEALAETSLGEAVADIYYQSPALSVEIPGLEFTDATKVGEVIQSNYLAEYVNAVYTWLISASALIVIVVMMIGGLEYMLARGKPAMIQKATGRMKNALIGLVLVMSAYTIAYLIDPNTVRFESLSISYIDPKLYDDEIKDTDGFFSVAATEGYASSQGILPGDILCDTSYSIAEIAESAVGKMTYRMGGKGNAPPYSADTKTDPDGVQYSTYCPAGTVCYDCSGFSSFVRQCAGLSSVGGTSSIFDSSAQRITNYTTTGYINGIKLEPGDMVGRPSWHVWIYIGDGRWAESHADRNPGKAIAITDWSYPFKIMSKYEDAYVKISH